MKRLAVVALVLASLVWPVSGRAQSEAVARGGSATYSGLNVMLGTTDAPHRLFLAFEAQCTDEKGATLAVSPQAKEAVLLFLRGKDAAELMTEKGKAALKNELVAVLNKAIGSPRVVRVLFLQFDVR